MDAYSGNVTSPLLTQALLITRGVHARDFKPLSAEPPSPGPQVLAEALPKCDLDVRHTLYLFEFMEKISFSNPIDSGKWSSDKAASLIYDGQPFATVGPFVAVEIKNQICDVMNNAELRRDRMPEILTQVAVPVSYFAMALNLNPERHRHVFELMTFLFAIAKMTVMRFKLHFQVPRPADLCPAIEPMITTPGHWSYPAGHAVEGHLVTNVLIRLLQRADRKPWNSQEFSEWLIKHADRIGDNRVVAGLHYPKDIEEGKKLAGKLAGHLESRVGISTLPRAGEVDNGICKDASNLRWLFTQALRELQSI